MNNSTIGALGALVSLNDREGVRRVCDSIIEEARRDRKRAGHTERSNMGYSVMVPVSPKALRNTNFVTASEKQNEVSISFKDAGKDETFFGRVVSITNEDLGTAVLLEFSRENPRAVWRATSDEHVWLWIPHDMKKPCGFAQKYDFWPVPYK